VIEPGEPPFVSIRLEYEGRVTCSAWANSYAELDRLLAWLDSDERLRLLTDAAALLRDERELAALGAQIDLIGLEPR